MARSDADSWAAWHEDSFKLDVDSSPLALTRSLWDEIQQNESESGSLFSVTPAGDVTEAGALLSSLSHQEISQGEDEEKRDSPRQKRRRVLFFSSGGYEVSQSQPMVESSAWYPAPDDPRPQDYWMETCFNESDEQGCSNTGNVPVPVCQTASESSDCMQHDLPSSEAPVTPISVTRPPPAGRRRNPQQQHRQHQIYQQQQQQQRVVMQKVRSPVAYPFALVKPCGATGDVTLSDLNERLQTPRSKAASRRLSGELSAAEGAAAGLSGKSVVALTKIHTEGNGSITIMRTKG